MATPLIVALTGGPCAGKTTLLDMLRKRKSIAGRTLVFVPEAATMLVARGLIIGQDVVHFQTETMRLQLELEQKARDAAAKLLGPCIIVCDRGTLDGAGYCTAEQFASIADGFGQDRTSLARRYDLVIHLVSAAVDAPDAYTTGNNDARHESLEQAVEQEKRTLGAWSEHPNRVIVGSAASFDQKIEQAIAVIECACSSFPTLC